MQQYEVIKSNTELKVEEYYGAKGVDEWTAEIWAKEINKHHVSCILLILFYVLK